MQEEFLALVREERERGCAVFLSSHELDEVERVCDRVGIIRDGRLIAVERVADLLGRDAAPRLGRVRRADRPGRAAGVPGVEDLEVDGRRVTFKFAGDLDPVIKAIAAAPVSDLEFARPTLEEVFLTYYEDGCPLIALVAAQLYERRRSLLSWGLPLGLWSAFIVAIYPSIEDALAKAVSNYPVGAEGGLRGRRAERRSSSTCTRRC